MRSALIDNDGILLWSRLQDTVLGSSWPVLQWSTWYVLHGCVVGHCIHVVNCVVHAYHSVVDCVVNVRVLDCVVDITV